ncbi:phage holin family protein [Paenibacillus macquariensis]|uniref:Toxin secretion/phage lysis holin n=1 Tax=Paenibacillus macquariensis TaxID=948756 RepID=A0ABY1JY66_9BACL|nr:phage holin family protein [Paenibacillus macquariensis]MEC0089179.1 phage holin family protein [Paenibacillus macquariensis]OAB33401.1 holin [Paenibacillus macquariensis subsp. macquariensis]SIQ97042.1 toxin secretion/phage lysis holin [Paenibacillus macquariensis]
MNTLVIQGASGLVGAVIAFTFGGWNQLLSIFLVVILIDYITGVLAAIKDKTGLNSKIGFWGITRKALMFIVILLAHQMDILLGQDLGVVKSGAIYFYMANELISITENYGRLGLPLPNKVTRIIKILKNKDTSDDDKS